MRVTLSRCHTGPPHAEARTCPWRRAGARADDPAPCFGPCAESPLVPNTQQRRGRRGPGCLLGDRHPSTNTSDSHSDRLPFLFLSSLFLFFFFSLFWAVGDSSFTNWEQWGISKLTLISGGVVMSVEHLQHK